MIGTLIGFQPHICLFNVTCIMLFSFCVDPLIPVIVWFQL